MATPSITREKVLAFRQRATYLHRRLPPGRLVEAAFAGLQDSSPRSAVLALHARVTDVSPSAWKDPGFVQVWGPRGAVYVVPAQDVSVFTVGRFPRNPVLGAAVKAAAEKVRRAFRARQAQPRHVRLDRAVGLNFRDLRIASMTGEVRIEWDGATTSWRIVEPPTGDRNPLASSWRVGSCGRSGLRRPRNSRGGQAGGRDLLAHLRAESFPTRSRRFVLSKRNLRRLNSKVRNAGCFGRTVPGWNTRCPLKRCACCRPETRIWRRQTGHCSSHSRDFDPNCGPSPCGQGRLW